jgi:CheY-like chemotaxis protein
MRDLRSILLVEDDSVDIMSVQRALKDRKIPNPLIHPRDGSEAMQYLNDVKNKKPCIIFLDLNMRNVDGFEFLKSIKEDRKLKRIPVVVITISKNIDDVSRCFELGVAGYVVKPQDYKEFAQMIETIDKYWTLSKSPNER